MIAVNTREWKIVLWFLNINSLTNWPFSLSTQPILLITNEQVSMCSLKFNKKFLSFHIFPSNWAERRPYIPLSIHFTIMTNHSFKHNLMTKLYNLTSSERVILSGLFRRSSSLLIIITSLCVLFIISTFGVLARPNIYHFIYLSNLSTVILTNCYSNYFVESFFLKRN